MTRFFAEPPQSHEDSQQLRTVGGPSRPYIRPPQGLQSEGVPSADSELIEESVGVFDNLIFNDGTETGNVLVEE